MVKDEIEQLTKNSFSEENNGNQEDRKVGAILDFGPI